MRHLLSKSGWCVILLLILAGGGYGAQRHRMFHTTPDKWKKPRIFHTPFKKDYESKLVLSHREIAPTPQLKVLSPNGAYWVGMDPSTAPELWVSEPRGAKFHVESPDFPIYIFNERAKMLTLAVKDHYPNFTVEVRWINEKLLYVKVWWGRVLGSYVIIDVEREAIVYEEMVNDGAIAFRQWQQAKPR